jgi:hypothetical protein
MVVCRPVVQMNTKEGRFVQDAAQVFDGISRSGVSIQVLVGKYPGAG